MDSAKYSLLIDDDFTPPELSGGLYGILPRNSGRYDRTTSKLVEKGSMMIPAGLFAYAHEPDSPPYLPSGWNAHIHPEGQLYFFRDGPLRIVTEAYIYEAEKLRELEQWLRVIEKNIANAQLKVTGAMELFILPWKGDCFYYFADYQSRTIFLLEAEDSKDLGFLDVASPSHLKLCLQDEFWTHVSHFPMHWGLERKAVDDLIAILCHALTDQSTSLVSTYSYTHEQLRDYLNFLQLSRENISDGHHICAVARLYHGIYRHRFHVHYGQAKTRLSRDQTICYEFYQGNGVVDLILSIVTFKTSRYYLAKLNNIFTDRVAYTPVWQPFANQCLEEWRNVSYLAFAALMLHLFLLSVQGNVHLGVASFGLFGAALSSSLMLGAHYRLLAKKTAGSVYSYLSKIESKKVGFRWPAFVFALPYTFFLWGLVALFGQCLYLTSNQYGNNAVYGLLAFAVIAFFGIQRPISPTSVKFSSLIPSFLKRSEKSEDDMV